MGAVFYIFAAGLAVFLLYKYRHIIREKLGYLSLNDPGLIQSVQELQHELRGTADVIITQFSREQERMEHSLIVARERIDHLEELLRQAEEMQNRQTQQTWMITKKDAETVNAEDQRRRIVCQMAEYGMDIHEINKATGIGYGEVRLLLNIGRVVPGENRKEEMEEEK